MEEKRHSSHLRSSSNSNTTIGPTSLNSSISNIDFSAIEELDPSISDGYRIIYDRECPLELRFQETAKSPQEVGTLEAIKVKILLLVRERFGKICWRQANNFQIIGS